MEQVVQMVFLTIPSVNGPLVGFTTVSKLPHSFHRKVPLYFILHLIFYLIPRFVSFPEPTGLPPLHFPPRLLSSKQAAPIYFFLIGPNSVTSIPKFSIFNAVT